MRSKLFKEPVTETVNVTEARRCWSDLLNRVFRRESRVIVEKSGIPVAAIISIREYEFFLSMKAKRAERFKILDEMREAFKDVSPEETEREVAKAIAEVRAENRAREHAEREQTTREQAEYLVTGDRDLLRLASYQGIIIVSPRAFLATLGGL
jgi:prevent-host-death family protein